MADQANAITDDPRFMAAVDMLGRTGARDFTIRYCDEEMPVVWSVVVTHPVQRHNEDGSADVLMHQEAAGALNPLQALFRLCEIIIDGGMCTHCHRPTSFVPDLQPQAMPADQFVCWYTFDADSKSFVRGCQKHER
jgi:hypothetical protein